MKYTALLPQPVRWTTSTRPRRSTSARSPPTGRAGSWRRIAVRRRSSSSAVSSVVMWNAMRRVGRALRGGVRRASPLPVRGPVAIVTTGLRSRRRGSPVDRAERPTGVVGDPSNLIRSTGEGSATWQPANDPSPSSRPPTGASSRSRPSCGARFLDQAVLWGNLVSACWCWSPGPCWSPPSASGRPWRPPWSGPWSATSCSGWPRAGRRHRRAGHGPVPGPAGGARLAAPHRLQRRPGPGLGHLRAVRDRQRRHRHLRAVFGAGGRPLWVLAFGAWPPPWPWPGR